MFHKLVITYLHQTSHKFGSTRWNQLKFSQNALNQICSTKKNAQSAYLSFIILYQVFSIITVVFLIKKEKDLNDSIEIWAVVMLSFFGVLDKRKYHPLINASL